MICQAQSILFFQLKKDLIQKKRKTFHQGFMDFQMSSTSQPEYIIDCYIKHFVFFKVTNEVLKAQLSIFITRAGNIKDNSNSFMFIMTNCESFMRHPQHGIQELYFHHFQNPPDPFRVTGLLEPTYCWAEAGNTLNSSPFCCRATQIHMHTQWQYTNTI